MGDLERVLSTQCPRLQKLALGVSFFNSVALSICSDSLRELRLGGGDRVIAGHVTVDAPRLTRLEMSGSSSRTTWRRKRVVYGVNIVAPELAELICHAPYSQCDHQIVTSQPRLRKLVVGVNVNREALVSSRKTLMVMGQFDTVDELELHIITRHVTIKKLRV